MERYIECLTLSKTPPRSGKVKECLIDSISVDYAFDMAPRISHNHSVNLFPGMTYNLPVSYLMRLKFGAEPYGD
jgi:hypothetical protein